MVCRFTNPSAIPSNSIASWARKPISPAPVSSRSIKLNNLRYASPIVNVVADARIEHGPGLGTFAYDDEGVPAQCIDIIKDGQFRGYLSSRETAHLIGLQRSGGTMRTEGWNRLPMIRMTNVSLLPGTWNFENLIADTDDGILMETNRSWSIDDRRYQFQFSTEIAWEIKGGKKGRMLKNPSYSGITTEFWNSCDAICNADHWVLWGTPNCGKGQPMQTMGTGHGAVSRAFSQRKNRNGIFQRMSTHEAKSASPRQAHRASAAEVHFRPERELRRIADTVFRLAKCAVLAGNRSPRRRSDRRAHPLRQQHHPPERCRTRRQRFRIRTVMDGRTARVTTNRMDEDSFRGRASNPPRRSPHSQPKDPSLLPLPGKQNYRNVNRFSPQHRCALAPKTAPAP